MLAVVLLAAGLCSLEVTKAAEAGMRPKKGAKDPIQLRPSAT